MKYVAEGEKLVMEVDVKDVKDLLKFIGLPTDPLIRAKKDEIYQSLGGRAGVDDIIRFLALHYLAQVGPVEEPQQKEEPKAKKKEAKA